MRPPGAIPERVKIRRGSRKQLACTDIKPMLTNWSLKVGKYGKNKLQFEQEHVRIAGLNYTKRNNYHLRNE